MVPCLVFTAPPLPHIWYVGLPPLLHRGGGIHRHTRIQIHIHTVYKDICTYTYYIRIHTHMYVCMYIYIYISCIYIYNLHIHIGTITISGGGGDHQTLGHMYIYICVCTCIYIVLYIIASTHWIPLVCLCAHVVAWYTYICAYMCVNMQHTYTNV